MTTSEIKNLKVGDEIAFSASCNHYMPQFDRIAKITPTGIITTKGGRRFNTSGNEMKTKIISYPNAFLTDVGTARQHIAQRTRDNETQKQVKAVQDWFISRRTSNGHYCITEEKKAELLKLVGEITINQET